MTDRTRRQRGQVSPLALVAVAFAAVLALGLVRVGVAARDRALVEAAADAAALAGAAGGERSAAAVAGANGATLVSYAVVGDLVRVTVEARGGAATASARWASAPIP